MQGSFTFKVLVLLLSFVMTQHLRRFSLWFRHPINGWMFTTNTDRSNRFWHIITWINLKQFHNIQGSFFIIIKVQNSYTFPLLIEIAVTTPSVDETNFLCHVPSIETPASAVFWVAHSLAAASDMLYSVTCMDALVSDMLFAVTLSN